MRITFSPGRFASDTSDQYIASRSQAVSPIGMIKGFGIKTNI